MAKIKDEDGVWRTVGGRRIFIRTGEGLADAMKRSGKFKRAKDIEHQQRKINNELAGLTGKDKEKADEEYDAYEKLKKLETEEELYKRAKEHPETIDPMTENSTDWEALDKKYGGKEKYSYSEIIDEMENAEDYSELYSASKKIADADLRKQVENAIDQAENDGFSVDEAYSTITSDYLDTKASSGDKNVASKNEEAKKSTNTNKLDDSGYNKDRELKKQDMEHDLKWFEDMEKKYPSEGGLKENEDYQSLLEDYEAQYGKRIVEDVETGERFHEVGNGQWRSEKSGHDYWLDFNSANKDNPVYKDVSESKNNSDKRYAIEKDTGSAFSQPGKRYEVLEEDTSAFGTKSYKVKDEKGEVSWKKASDLDIESDVNKEIRKMGSNPDTYSSDAREDIKNNIKGQQKTKDELSNKGYDFKQSRELKYKDSDGNIKTGEYVGVGVNGEVYLQNKDTDWLVDEVDIKDVVSKNNDDFGKYKVSKTDAGKEYINPPHPYDETKYSYAEKNKDNSWVVRDPLTKENMIVSSKNEAISKMKKIDDYIQTGEQVRGFEGTVRYYEPNGFTRWYNAFKEYKKAHPETKLDVYDFIKMNYN